MQSIITNNGFGFCKASSFRNCNNCFYKLRCISYVPNYTSNLTYPSQTRNLNLSNNKIFEQNLNNNSDSLIQENIALKEKIQDLENQILNLNQSKNIETQSNKVANPEESISGLQVYENKNLEVSPQEESLLKPQRGIFGTKFLEEKPKKK